MSDGFPVTMRHPAQQAAVLNVSNVAVEPDKHGSPDRFAPVTVNNERQEEEYRAKGYRRFDEAPTAAPAYLEYPKILVHPDHVEGTKATQESIVQAGKVVVVAVPPTPEKFPHKTVSSHEEEEEWTAKGYAPAGTFDYPSYDRMLNAPGTPGDEWPKYVDGVLMADPSTRYVDANKYPMWLHFDDGTDVLAQNEADEGRLREVHDARGSSKNEPVQKTESGFDPDYAEFLQWKMWKAQQTSAPPLTVTIASPSPPPAPDVADLEDLRRQATELGVVVDKRWGERTLQREIDLALSK